jgi:exodeoxyribonuclease VII small subunit
MARKKTDYQIVKTQLDDVLAKLQQPDVQVDEAVELYRQGLALASELEQYLEQAENTIKQLKLQVIGKAD